MFDDPNTWEERSAIYSKKHLLYAACVCRVVILLSASGVARRRVVVVRHTRGRDEE